MPTNWAPNGETKVKVWSPTGQVEAGTLISSGFRLPSRSRDVTSWVEVAAESPYSRTIRERSRDGAGSTIGGLISGGQQFGCGVVGGV